ncbi:hypothetical protein KFK09_023638 [Dendrobium nobile]|uniref:Uncharacterized protein n=1 Tax=Dendrobium nobile TaxID=94219 RepID=A0A8T3ABI2_DENNO|nr:hypothetical protein KFK09_023638 [Dendrobium nobile]
MMLKSSSTPILGSLISSSSALFSESPNNGFQLHHHHHNLDRTVSSSPSILHGISQRYPHISDSSERESSAGMIRRTRSEGNIKDLLSSCSDDSQAHRSLKPYFSRRRDAALETIPSFSLYSYKTVEEDEEEKIEDQEEDYQIAEKFSFLEHGEKNGVDLSFNELSQRASQPLFLARGLGIDRLASGLMNLGVDGGAVMVGGGGGGDGRDGNCSLKTDHGGEGYELEMYYKRVIEEDPGNALILRNYAQFLYECKRNLVQAEEYYSRAILADPDDAETISQYGKLVWELHGDFERASTYIERAANIDQNNCFVQAAYASFLWETAEEEVEEDDGSQELCEVPFQLGTLASAGA